MFNDYIPPSEVLEVLEDRKQRILETVANMLVDRILDRDTPLIGIRQSILKILQDNFDSYEIRNKA